MGCCCSAEDEVTPLLGAKSARYKSSPKGKPDQVGCRHLKIKSVNIQSLDDKTMKEAEFYHGQLDRLDRLREMVGQIRNLYPEHKCSSISDVFYHVKTLMKNKHIKVDRKTQYCIEIRYNSYTVDEEAKPAIDLFNSANILTKEIMDNSQPLIVSVNSFLRNDSQHRSEILSASLKDKGPASLKAFLHNVKELQLVLAVERNIREEAIRKFEELKTGAQLLFQ